MNTTQNPRHGFLHVQFHSKIEAGSGKREKEMELGTNLQELRLDLTGKGPATKGSCIHFLITHAMQGNPRQAGGKCGTWTDEAGAPWVFHGEGTAEPEHLWNRGAEEPWERWGMGPGLGSKQQELATVLSMHHFSRLLNMMPSGAPGQNSAPSEPL